METSIYKYEKANWVPEPLSSLKNEQKADLVLCFGGKEELKKEGVHESLKSRFPFADVAMCSTAGEILQNRVLDNSLIAVALHFRNTGVRAEAVSIHDYSDSYEAAKALSSKLQGENLTYIMVLSDGGLVNGSELVKGFSAVNDKVLVTGGLAGDGPRFESTLVGLNARPTEGQIIAIGFYGTKLKVAHGSQGGWEVFGLEKEVTRAEANVLYEIEHQSALSLYKKYLGEASADLPGAALLFPLSVIIPGSAKPIVRTILSINEEEQSMTFAGDVPVGSKVQLMRANFDRLRIAASNAAAVSALDGLPATSFALLISCVGRKLVLGPRVDEEVEAVEQTFGRHVQMAGFYSYGEISPFNEGGGCQLHNQTMTITNFYELP